MDNADVTESARPRAAADSTPTPPAGSSNGNGRGTFFARLVEARDDLRSSEIKVAEYIEQNPESAAGMSIAELATASGTSEATVNRFSRALSYKGYGELKIDLVRADMLGTVKSFPSSIDPSDDIGTVAGKLVQSMAQSAADANKSFDADAVRRAVDTIISADHVYFYGIGGSGYVADIAYHLFLKAGLLTTSCSNGYLQAVTSVLVTDRDVVIGISDSGVTRDVVNAMRNARERGASTIAITGQDNAPIAAEADIVILTGSQQVPLYGDFVEARIGQLFVIDLLYVAMLLRDVPTYTRRIVGTANAIQDRALGSD